MGHKSHALRELGRYFEFPVVDTLRKVSHDTTYIGELGSDTDTDRTMGATNPYEILGVSFDTLGPPFSRNW